MKYRLSVAVLAALLGGSFAFDLAAEESPPTVPATPAAPSSPTSPPGAVVA